MPGRPLSLDRKAVTALHTRVDVEAIDIEKGRTDRAAAVPRLVQLVPPHRDDLVNEVLYPIGKRGQSARRWPPYGTVCELATAVKAVHLGEVKLRGPGGVSLEVVSYTDKMQTFRQVYRLRRHGRHVGDYKNVEDLGKHVDLPTLVEDGDGRA